jgi:hypothetical protein
VGWDAMCWLLYFYSSLGVDVGYILFEIPKACMDDRGCKVMYAYYSVNIHVPISSV